MPRRKCVNGRVTWPTLNEACTYANVRAIIHKTRQEVRPMIVDGRTVWYARKARVVAEPCS